MPRSEVRSTGLIDPFLPVSTQTDVAIRLRSDVHHIVASRQDEDSASEA